MARRRGLEIRPVRCLAAMIWMMLLLHERSPTNVISFEDAHTNDTMLACVSVTTIKSTVLEE